MTLHMLLKEVVPFRYRGLERYVHALAFLLYVNADFSHAHQVIPVPPPKAVAVTCDFNQLA